MVWVLPQEPIYKKTLCFVLRLFFPYEVFFFFFNQSIVEFEQALGDGEGQGGLVCCSPWGRKELDTTERLNYTLGDLGFPSGSAVKNLPANAEDLGSIPGIPLEKEMAPHSSILACRIPWTEEPGRLQSIASQRVGHN